MAKLFKDCYGNSMNLKFTLKNNEGVSIVNDTLGENAISGILKHLNDFMIFYAPTVNAYKRLKEPSLTQNWNKMGRMTESNGVNILTENYTDKVLFMIPGSDANPYFTVFALLTSVNNHLTFR